MNNLNNQGLLDAALEIGARRAQTLRAVRQFLVDGEDRKAVELMKKFFGLDEQTSRADRRYPRSLAPVKGK